LFGTPQGSVQTRKWILGKSRTLQTNTLLQDNNKTHNAYIINNTEGGPKTQKITLQTSASVHKLGQGQTLYAYLLIIYVRI